jgi:hypothetical protein
MSFYFSKSKYTEFFKCPKASWLSKYRPEEKIITEIEKQTMEEGNYIGDIGMALLGDYVEVTTLKDDGSLDYTSMVEKTKQEMARHTSNICEASFVWEDVGYCAVDILHDDNDGGYSIYEIKATKKVKPYHIADIAYQRHVLELNGVKINKTYLVKKDDNYIRGDAFSIQEFFQVIDVTDDVLAEKKSVPGNIAKAKKLLETETEPNINICPTCSKDCNYYAYCKKVLPEYSIYDLYKIQPKTKEKYLAKGILSYDDLAKSDIVLKKVQKRQVEYYNRKDACIDKTGITKFLDTLKFPLYFLDFESIMPPVPQYKGMKTGQQELFQFSLHSIEHKCDTERHKEYLGVSGEDNRYELAKKLVEFIPKNSSVIVFNKTFEKTRIKELAEWFPDLREDLLDINENIADLLDIFTEGHYYHKELGGSLSIKNILPHFFPDNDELDYHKLEGVHHGGEAMTVFPQIKDMPIDEQKKVRSQLLAYCKLDTLATVRIYQKLLEFVK